MTATFTVTNINSGVKHTYNANMTASEAIRDAFRKDVPNYTEFCPVNGSPTLTCVAKFGKRAYSIWVEAVRFEPGAMTREMHESARYSVSGITAPVSIDVESEE